MKKMKAQELLTEQLDQIRTDLGSAGKYQDGIMMVETLDGTFHWEGAIGKSDTEKRQKEERPFFIASIDKLLNATVLLLLSEEGLVHIDTPIRSYLPAEMTEKIHVYKGKDYSAEITVRHLLSHTSGLADWLEDIPRGGTSRFERIIKEGDWEFDMEDVAEIVRSELQPHFASQDLSAMRTKARYSDTNFMLIIAIIEAVTGQPLHQVHDTYLYKRLGMHDTFFAGHPSASSHPAPTPVYLEGKPLDIPNFLRSDRGIYSTTKDLTIFLRNFFSGAIFVHEKTKETMMENWVRFGFPLDRAALRAPGWPIEYGLGMMRFQLPSAITLGKKYPAVLGHTGSTGCWLFYCPENELILAGSVNEATAGAVPYRVVPKIAGLF